MAADQPSARLLRWLQVKGFRTAAMAETSMTEDQDQRNDGQFGASRADPLRITKPLPACRNAAWLDNFDTDSVCKPSGTMGEMSYFGLPIVNGVPDAPKLDPIPRGARRPPSHHSPTLRALTRPKSQNVDTDDSIPLIIRLQLLIASERDEEVTASTPITAPSNQAGSDIEVRSQADQARHEDLPLSGNVMTSAMDEHLPLPLFHQTTPQKQAHSASATPQSMRRVLSCVRTDSSPLVRDSSAAVVFLPRSKTIKRASMSLEELEALRHHFCLLLNSVPDLGTDPPPPTSREKAISDTLAKLTGSADEIGRKVSGRVADAVAWLDGLAVSTEARMHPCEGHHSSSSLNSTKRSEVESSKCERTNKAELSDLERSSRSLEAEPG